MNGLSDTILEMMDTVQEPEDYVGEDGLLYCGKCRKPKEAYFLHGKNLFGRDRHPSECDCRRAERERSVLLIPCLSLMILEWRGVRNTGLNRYTT